MQPVVGIDLVSCIVSRVLRFILSTRGLASKQARDAYSQHELRGTERRKKHVEVGAGLSFNVVTAARSMRPASTREGTLRAGRRAQKNRKAATYSLPAPRQLKFVTD